MLKKADGSSGAPALTSLDLSGNGLEGPRACKPLADVLRVTARSPGESNPLQDQRSVRGAHTLFRVRDTVCLNSQRPLRCVLFELCFSLGWQQAFEAPSPPPPRAPGEQEDARAQAAGQPPERNGRGHDRRQLPGARTLRRPELCMCKLTELREAVHLRCHNVAPEATGISSPPPLSRRGLVCAR